MLRRIVSPLVVLLLNSLPAKAQQTARPPQDGGITRSLGQPAKVHWHAGAGAGWMFGANDAELVAEGRAGLYTDLALPPAGLLGLQMEAYGGARSSSLDYGLRLQVFSPSLRFGAGVDLNGLDGKDYFLLSAAHPLRRGGVFRRGSHLKANYLPGRNHSFNVGVQVPIGPRTHAGRTRPLRSAAPLERGRRPPTQYADPPPALRAAIGELAQSAGWIASVTTPFLEYGAPADGDPRELAVRELRKIRDYIEQRVETLGDWAPEDEVRRFHTALDHAFSLASGVEELPESDCTELGRLVAAEARRIVLDEILIPYDRLLGQIRESESLLGLGIHARGIFLRWLYTDPRIPPDRIDAFLWVFTRLIDVLEDNRRTLLDRWQDSRLVWLPLQYALLPDQHDSQAELDSLIERLTGVEFTEGNHVWFVVNEQFPLQLARMIHATRNYHVLWVHDIRGRDDLGNPDEMTYRYALGAYLAAMTRRVREYDRTGSFPVFMIFLDEWYYHGTGGRFWLNLLEDPLRHSIEFPPGYESWQDTVRAAQAALRAAVQESRLLQEQTAQYGSGWLHNLIKVHVNITNPADNSFWRDELIPLLGLPDNVMRDHRKIAFYDIGEDDPYRGGAVYTGAGVGEHYVTVGWEDRAIVAEGPALLTLKAAARALLLNQGIPAEEIPWALQPRPLAPDYHDRVRAHRDTARLNVRAIEVHNETGYNPKNVTVLKAVLYTMMPAGSVALVPDALWGSGFWASLLTGQALRGGRVLIVAPAPGNAPTTRMNVMARAYDVQAHLLLASDILREPIARRGGLLKVGIYAPRSEVTDLEAKLSAFRSALETHKWFRELYNLSSEVYAEMQSLGGEMRDQNARWERTLRFERTGPPQLHVKAVFLASPEAWTGLLARPEWAQVLRAFLRERAWQIENRDRALGHLDTSVPDVIDVGQPMVDRWLAELNLEQRSRLALFLVVGSHNHDYRSMVLDGEAAFVVAGTSINAGLIDLVSIMGQSTWVESVDELAELLPRPTGWKLRLTRWLKILL
jgi:hypothetical protein